MPFSGNRDFKSNPRLITGASGHYYTTHDGRRIFDEVITGFGTGYWTGAEAFGVTPDIIKVAKQITNGVQPLGVCGKFRQVLRMRLRHRRKSGKLSLRTSVVRHRHFAKRLRYST